MRNTKKPPKRKNVTERKFSTETMIAAIRASMGSVAHAARTLKCKRPTIYNYMKEFPEVAKALGEVRKSYQETCRELARDNHLNALLAGEGAATHYELAKMDPKPLGVSIDPRKLSDAELIDLRRLLEKARPDGADQSAI